MFKLLILYPAEFRCQSKFERKVSKITCRMIDYGLVFPSDHNQLIANFFGSEIPKKEIQSVELADAGITHAIVFADDEVFEEELNILADLAVSIRRIRIEITRVVNIKKDTQYAHLKSNAEYEYIGRGSYWGNPYSMFAEGDSREEVIRKFKYDFDNDKFAKKERSQVFKLVGKRLGCFCKPDACHGDVLADFLNAWDDGQ